MTKLHLSVLSFIILSSLFSGCVTQAEYAETLDQLTYYKEQSVVADSLVVENTNLSAENRMATDDYAQVVREMEELKAANVNLHRSYGEVLERLNQLKYENDEVMAASSYENLGLQESLAEMQARLDAKSRELAKLEYELYQKETRLNMREGNFNESGSAQPSEANYKLREIESIAKANKKEISAVNRDLKNALRNYPLDEIKMMEKGGKLYISLSSSLLFSGGNENISWNGKTALRKISDVLTQYRDLDITVTGHTASDGIASKNWDISVIRATSVVKVLSSFGIAPESIIAAGRGFYDPVASNSTAAGRVENTRTEIILSPNQGEWNRLFDR